MMKKMKSIVVTMILTTSLLAGCSSEPQQQYEKDSGQIIGTSTEQGRFSMYYYAKVAVKLQSGKYIINSIQVQKEVYDSIKIGDNVTIYANENHIGGFVK